MPTALPVELVPIDEITNIMAAPQPQPEKEVEPRPKEPEAEEQKTALLEPPAPPEPESEPEPEITEDIPAAEETPPEPDLEEPPVEAETPPPPAVTPIAKPKPPKPQQVAEPEPEPEPERESTGDEFLDEMAALLDKLPEDTPPPQPERETPPDMELPDIGVGAQTALTMTEQDAFRAQMRKCWTLPAGAANPEELVVTLRVFMNPDGTLARAPELVDKGLFNLNTNAFYRTAAESALRAVQRCQPFQMPADKYQTWKVMELTFDPSSILR